MRLLLCILALALSFRPALARDLPQGEYLLMGNVFPAIEEQIMITTLAHVKTGGDRLEWTFFTYVLPDQQSCDSFGKCQRFVQSLSHKVAWDADGTLRILETERARGKGLTIDRPEIDETHIYGVLPSLLEGARLTLTPEGGALTRKNRRGGARQIDLLPASLERAAAALSMAAIFEISLAQLDGCAIRQVLAFAADPAPTKGEREVLAASRLAEDLRKMEAEEAQYTTDPEDPETLAALSKARKRYQVYRIAVAWPPIQGGTAALIAGTPLSDDAMMALIKEGLDRFDSAADPDYRAAIDEILATRAADAMAYARLSSRFAAMINLGADPVAAICADLTLGG